MLEEGQGIEDTIQTMLLIQPQVLVIVIVSGNVHVAHSFISTWKLNQQSIYGGKIIHVVVGLN